tara:strand:- start:2133 stop:2468 length:336 start_codon:yes stop_codon:yes gene_type:complete
MEERKKNWNRKNWKNQYVKGNPTEEQRINWKKYRAKNIEKIRERDRQARGFKARVPKYSFAEHREFAIHTGIETSREWKEVYKLGWMPDGIYNDPGTIFGNPTAIGMKPIK